MKRTKINRDTAFTKLPIEPQYQVRFIKEEHIGEIVNWYHLARVPLSGTKYGRYDQMKVAAKWYAETYPGVTSETGAYKDLCGILDQGRVFLDVST